MRKYFFFFVTIAFFSLIIFYYLTITLTNLNRENDYLTFAKKSINTSQDKTILYWNGFFGEKDFSLGEGRLAQNCPIYKNCFATHRRSLINVEKYDAIIFHGINEEFNPKDLPDKRRPEQRYVFAALESPSNRYVDRELNDFYNATMTYQLDSDVIWSYSDVTVISENERSSKNEDKRLMSVIKNKTKMAIWYKSNCRTNGRRENYVEELEKYLEVDKYGKCSYDRGCDKGKSCFKTVVEPNYFFYLSFENSLCNDYVTEKFFNPLE